MSSINFNLKFNPTDYDVELQASSMKQELKKMRAALGKTSDMAEVQRLNEAVVRKCSILIIYQYFILIFTLILQVSLEKELNMTKIQLSTRLDEWYSLRCIKMLCVFMDIYFKWIMYRSCAAWIRNWLLQNHVSCDVVLLDLFTMWSYLTFNVQ